MVLRTAIIIGVDKVHPKFSILHSPFYILNNEVIILFNLNRLFDYIADYADDERHKRFAEGEEKHRFD